MDDNFDIFCLYMFHGDMFPHFLEWATSENISDCLLFLIEADTIRFECTDYTVNISKMKRVFESYISSECIREAFKFCSLHNSLNIEYDDIRCNLEKTINSYIPLRCIFSLLCDVVWKYIVHVTHKIQYSTYWSNIKRLVLEDTFKSNAKFELITILNNPIFRFYYESYSKTNDIISKYMNCWVEVRRIMTTLNLIRLSQSNNSQHVNNEALKYASKALLSNSTAQFVKSHFNAYPSNPFEPLKLLLIELKKVKTVFFDNATINGTDGTKGHSDASSGISESIRLEILTLLSMTSSIRLSNIESIEFEFAMTCVDKIEKLFNTIERETFQYLQHSLPQFIDSHYFVMMICHTRAFDNTKMMIHSVISILKFTMQLQNYEYYGIDTIVSSTSLYKSIDVSLDSKLENALNGKVLIKFELNDFVYNNNLNCTVLGITAVMTNNHNNKATQYQDIKAWKINSSYVDIMMIVNENTEIILSQLVELCGINDYNYLFGRSSDNTSCISIILSYSESCKDIYSYYAELAPNNFEISNALIISLRMIYKYEEDNYNVGISLINTKLPYTSFNWLRSLSNELAINLDLFSDVSYKLNKSLPKLHLKYENLNEIYYGCQKNKQNQLLNPCTKFYGLCDISLSHVVKSCSVKVLSYILMVLLTGRNVILISNYSSLLTMILLVLPRLSWPFRLFTSNYCQTLASIEAIELWWSTIIYAMANTSAKNSKYITAIKTDIFMISSMHKWLSVNKPLTNVVIIDIDINEIIYPNKKNYNYGIESLDAIPPYLNSYDGNLLSMDNTAIRQLEIDINFALLTKNTEFCCCDSSSDDDNNYMVLKLLDEQMLLESNGLIEFSFMKYISSIFLIYLPQSILFYPNDNVVGCNISVLSQICKDCIINDNNRNIEEDSALQLCKDIAKTEAFLDLLIRHGIAIHNDLHVKNT